MKTTSSNTDFTDAAQRIGVYMDWNPRYDPEIEGFIPKFQKAAKNDPESNESAYDLARDFTCKIDSGATSATVDRFYRAISTNTPEL